LSGSRRKGAKSPRRRAGGGKRSNRPPDHDLLDAWKRWGPLVSALIFLLGGVARFDSNLSIIGDNAQFLILGQSIAEGNGLSQINEPDPRPHTKYPFFFPLLLGGLHILFPFSFLAPKILVLLLGVGSIYLLALLLTRYYSPVLAIPSVFLTAINPEILQFSHLVLSEIPYMFLSLAALILYVRWERSGSWKVLAIAFLVAVASYYTRSIGITLVMAFVFSELFRRRFRIAAILLVSFVLLAAPWVIRNRVVGVGDSYMRQFLAVYPYEPERGTLSPVEFVTLRMRANVVKYSTVEIGCGICADVLPGDETPLSPGKWKGLSILSTLLVVAGLANRLIRKRGVLEIYALFYLGICLAWPDVWASLRFLLPVLPFLFVFLFDALRTGALRLFSARSAWVVPAVAAALLSIPALHADKVLAQRPRIYASNWANYFRAADWVKANTPETAIVACRKPYLFYLRSQRRSESYLWSFDPDKVFQQFLDHGVEYVVVSQLSGTERKYLIPTMNKYAGRTEVIKQFPNPETFVVRLIREEQN